MNKFDTMHISRLDQPEEDFLALLPILASFILVTPFGKPIFKQKIYDELVNIYDDSSFELNLKYFNYETGLTMINNKFEELFKKKNKIYL